MASGTEGLVHLLQIYPDKGDLISEVRGGYVREADHSSRMFGSVRHRDGLLQG